LLVVRDDTEQRVAGDRERTGRRALADDEHAELGGELANPSRLAGALRADDQPSALADERAQALGCAVGGSLGVCDAQDDARRDAGPAKRPVRVLHSCCERHPTRLAERRPAGGQVEQRADHEPLGRGRRRRHPGSKCEDERRAESRNR
jgi:hypothetical protein